MIKWMMLDDQIYYANKLKSLKVAQVKDDIDDGCDGVCDVAW